MLYINTAMQHVQTCTDCSTYKSDPPWNVVKRIKIFASKPPHKLSASPFKPRNCWNSTNFGHPILPCFTNNSFQVLTEKKPLFWQIYLMPTRGGGKVIMIKIKIKLNYYKVYSSYFMDYCVGVLLSSA